LSRLAKLYIQKMPNVTTQVTLIKQMITSPHDQLPAVILPVAFKHTYMSVPDNFTIYVSSYCTTQRFVSQIIPKRRISLKNILLFR